MGRSPAPDAVRAAGGHPLRIPTAAPTVRGMRRILLAGLIPIALIAADGQPPAGPAITIYSAADPAAFDPQAALAAEHNQYNREEVPGFAMVRETRVLDLRAGENRIDVTDVAARIDPATVDLIDLADPAAVRVLEQRFLFDLVSSDKLLDRYLDRVIDLPDPIEGQPERRLSATLLSNQNGVLVLRTAQGVRTWQAGTHDVRLGELPGGLITRPTLRWLVQAQAAGKRTVRTAYQTDGLTWRADYRLVLAADEKTADLGAWVSILNASGGSWKDATLKLMAGEVRQMQPQQRGFNLMHAAQSDSGGFHDKAFFEYHLYTLGRRTDLTDRSTQQLALFPTVDGVTVGKRLIYDGAILDENWGDNDEPRTERDVGTRCNPQVDVTIRFENTEANRLGMPLPRGKLRLYKADADDGALEFIGEDVIDHTPKGLPVQVRVGAAFDVTGERKQVEFQVDEERHTITERFAITLRNAKPEPVAVTVREHFHRWATWQVVQQSDKFEKQDSRTGHFEVEVPAGGDKQVEYEVRYTW